MDEQLKKKFLKPITPATRLRTTQAAVGGVERILNRGAAGLKLKDQLHRFSRGRQDGDSPRWCDPNEVRESVLFAKTMYEARRISRAEYVIFRHNPDRINTRSSMR